MKYFKTLVTGCSVLAIAYGAFILFRKMARNKERLTALQCEATTSGGERCQREPIEGSAYCWQHEKVIEEHPVEAPPVKAPEATKERHGLLQS